MRICVLGAGGVFGQNFAQYAKDRGHEVLGIGRSRKKPEPYLLESNFIYHTLHLITQWEPISGMMEAFEPDVIVNFAAQAGLVPQSWLYPREFYETNTLLPVRIAQWLPRTCRYIHIGSSEVYGSVTSPADEQAPIRPSSPYAVSKAAADLHLLVLKDERITVIRPSNCYAEGQALYRLIPRAVLACLGGPRISLQGNPQKSYMHADDLSRAILLLSDKPGLYNCGPELPIKISTLVEMVATEFGMSLSDIADKVEGRANEDACFWINSEHLLRLGWKPQISLSEGISRMVKWGLKYRNELLKMPISYEFRP